MRFVRRQVRLVSESRGGTCFAIDRQREVRNSLTRLTQSAYLFDQPLDQLLLSAFMREIVALAQRLENSEVELVGECSFSIASQEGLLGCGDRVTVARSTLTATGSFASDLINRTAGLSVGDLLLIVLNLDTFLLTLPCIISMTN